MRVVKYQVHLFLKTIWEPLSLVSRDFPPDTSQSCQRGSVIELGLGRVILSDGNCAGLSSSSGFGSDILSPM